MAASIIPIRIPVYQPDLSGQEKAYVAECLESGWISSKGRYVQKFEEGIASYLGVPFAAGVCNGTAALQTALGALGVGPGDEILVPSFTYVASVNTIAATGATPVFIDSEPRCWQMDLEQVARKITSRTRAIMVVHLYGGMCPMDQLCALARAHNLLVIEDCAEALGSSLNGTLAGAWGDIATFSFYGNKTLTTGEGGMVACKDARLFHRAVLFKGQGLSPHTEYWHETLGFNYRLTNVAAAIGVAQLERIESILAKKRQLAAWYQQELASLPLVFQELEPGVVSSWWMVSVLCRSTAERAGVREALRAAGIETRPLFPPVHAMPMYNQLYQKLPVAEDLAARGLNLPSYPALEKKQVQEITGVIREFFAREKTR